MKHIKKGKFIRRFLNTVGEFLRKTNIQKKILSLANQKYTFYVLVLIIILGVILRFYNVPLRYGFDGDSVRDAIVAYYGSHNLEFPLTGNFSSVGPFTFGPFFRIQLILFSFILPSIYAPFIYISILSVVFIYLMYRIGKFIGGEFLGLVAALLAAISPRQIMIGTGLNNPNPVAVFSAAFILVFLHAVTIKKDSLKLGILMGVFLALGIDAHTQMLPMLAMPLLLLGYRIIKKNPFLKMFCGLGLGFIAIFIPFILFNLLQDWHTVKWMIFSYTEGKDAIYVPNRWLFYLRDFWPRLWGDVIGVPPVLGAVLATVSVAVVVLFACKRKIPTSMYLLLITLVINFVLLRFYWGERHIVYFNYIHPFIILFTAYFLIKITKIPFGKYCMAIVLSLLVIMGLRSDVVLLQPNNSHAEFNSQAYILMKEFSQDQITLYNCKDVYATRAEAVALVLDSNDRLTKNGKKIALITHDCDVPRGVSLSPLIATVSAELIDRAYPPIGNKLARDFSSATISALLESGWREMNLKDVFDDEVNWWQNKR